MAKFYFTYDKEGHPFVGGWTEVEAEEWGFALDVMQIYHPDKPGGAQNYRRAYGEKHFKETDEYKSGNHGNRCHEAIVLRREVFA